MHIRSCIVLWVTFSSATRWGQRGQLTSPEMSRGARSDLNFFVFFGLPAVKLFRRGLQSLKLMTRWAHNIKLSERAPNWSRETTCKKNLLPNRALQRLPTGAGLYCSCQDRPLLKRNSCQSGPLATSICRIVPVLKLSRRALPKEIDAKAGR